MDHLLSREPLNQGARTARRRRRPTAWIVIRDDLRGWFEMTDSRPCGLVCRPNLARPAWHTVELEPVHAVEF
jgi:hypothetical protein